MNKTAFLFPGQGAQYIGMAKDFYDAFAESRRVFELASDSCGLDMKQLCFEDNDRLDQTEYTQIAMLTATLAVLEGFKKCEVRADVHAGLSLGEYGAIVASGIMSLEDAFRIVRKRGILMHNAVSSGGGMAAVIGGGIEVIEQVCKETRGIVSVANYNCPGQIVITGETDAVKRAGDSLKKAGIRRVIPLNVSGPFHSRLLTDAGIELRKALSKVQLHEIKVPYITNVDARYVIDKNKVKDLLAEQVFSPVRWQQSIERMIADGVDTFIEIGPGKTLSGFMRKINRDVSVYNIGQIGDLEGYRNAVGE